MGGSTPGGGAHNGLPGSRVPAGRIHTGRRGPEGTPAWPAKDRLGMFRMVGSTPGGGAHNGHPGTRSRLKADNG